MTPPDFPFGNYQPNANPSPDQRKAAIEEIGMLPGKLQSVLESLEDTEINETKYKNWTIRQIVNHLADSHANALLRIKLALTADSPRVFAYDPGAFVALADSAELPVEVSLAQLDAMHIRLTYLLNSLSDNDFDKGYLHPEQNRVVPIKEAIGLYAWHGQHHAAQIQWIRTNRLERL